MYTYIHTMYVGKLFFPQALGLVQSHVQGFKDNLVHYFYLVICLRMLDRSHEMLATSLDRNSS